MNTLKTVFGKLFKEETQLASHEVELATAIDDYYKKLTTTVGNKITEYENLLQQIIKAKDLLKKTYDKVNKEGDLLYADYDKKARELGIAMNDIPNFKKMWDAKTFISDSYYSAIEKQLK